ncbi:DUF6713 family protein [Enterococcus sp. AZ196]|uniref:DUF6713 family protein n=1 Tax=Enterococcus sp. AZ196 TaxID=2774659 RepID=UPI003D278CAD
MSNFLNVLFAIELALLLTHEMDAVEHKEWRMFIGLSELTDSTAYWVFTLPHIILYALVLFFLLLKQSVIFYVVDFFLVGHLFLHFLFRHHPKNQLTSFWSKLIIVSSGVCAGMHLILLSIR